MNLRKLSPLLMAGALGIAGCVDQEVPTAVIDPAPAALSVASETGRYLVDVQGQMARFQSRVTALGGTVVFAHDRTGIAIVEGLDQRAAASLVSAGVAKEVVPDALLELDLPTELELAGAAVASPEDPTTAFRYPWQWHHQAIKADVAWAAGRLGSPAVRVAILDTGLDYNFPDLVGRVDLARSTSFVPSDDALVAAIFPGAHPVADLHYHGTHVGATVASNALVAAGVTSQATLMGVKVCNVNGSCPTSGVLAGVLWATDNGADVINMSRGGATLRSGSEGFLGLLNRVYNHANRSGVTVVVAAGNNASDLDRNYYWLNRGEPDAEYVHFPSLFATYCDVATTLCVAATGPTARASQAGPWTNWDAPTSYTNFGRSAIDVAAPGGSGSNGAVVAGCSTFSLVIPVCRTDIYVLSASGTSMASPHVAGLAALLVEDLGRNPGRIRAAIQNTADDVGARGVDPYSGKGRINVARALGLI
jgi:lantibiotic leader peptide-processing serine protease